MLALALLFVWQNPGARPGGGGRKEGRVNIPPTLRQYADIQKECVCIGVSNRVEIWSKERWEEYFAQSEGSFGDIAEKLVDFNL